MSREIIPARPVFVARRALRVLADDSTVEEVYAALATAFTATTTPVDELPGAVVVASADAEAILDGFATALTSEVSGE